MAKTVVEVDEDLKDLIPQFLENRKQDISVLKDLVEKKDIESISQLSHKIKGAAAGYGFKELSDIAARIETASKNNDDSNLKSLAQAMYDHFKAIDIKYVPM